MIPFIPLNLNPAHIKRFQQMRCAVCGERSRQWYQAGHKFYCDICGKSLKILRERCLKAKLRIDLSSLKI